MNWEERPVKAQARDWLFNIVTKTLETWPKGEKCLPYLGLPAGQAIFERRLAEYYKKVDLTLFEMDKEVLQELAITVANYLEDDTNIQYQVYHEDIDHYIAKMVNPLQIVWLDYCGPITPDRLKSLRYCLSMRPKNGIVAVTFMAGRERPDGNTLLDFFNESYMGVNIDYDKELVPSYFLRRVRAVSELAKSVDNNINIQVLPYKDHAPMMLFVFKDCQGVRPTIEIEPFLKE